MGLMTRVLSPYMFNPTDYNPLRDVVGQSIDFDVLRHPDCPVKLFLSATNVRSGKVKIFTGSEISLSAVMASACLPTMFHAVEIGDDAYWDGGYMGNPALFPLIYGCNSTDIVMVHINPLFRKEVPHSAEDILNRINEISFNSSLMREMRAVSFVTKLITQNRVIEGGLKVNMVPSACRFEADIRLPLGVTREQVMAVVHKVLAAYPQATAEELNFNPPSYCPPDGAMVGIIQENVQSLRGFKPQPIVSLGGTDARLWRYRDIPAYVYGPFPHGMGSADEHVDLEEFLHILRVHLLSAYDYLMRQ